jgi:hypothetical protein
VTSPDQEFVFGPFRLSERARLLLRDETPLLLPSHAFDLDGATPPSDLGRFSSPYLDRSAVPSIYIFLFAQFFRVVQLRHKLSSLSEVEHQT